MKINCQREALLAAFQTAATVAPVRSPKSIIKNVKLQAVDSTLIVTATDMEVGIKIELPDVDVQSPGEAVVPVSQFGGMLRESNDESLSIEADPQATTVRGRHSELKLSGENPAEFPEVGSFEGDSYHEVPARLFRELIRRTLFATDAESSRYALGGVLLELETEQITAVATDGRRLAKMCGPAQSVGGHETGTAMTIVPSRAMQLIERALTDADAEIQIATTANSIVVKSPRATINAQLVEGRFPKWKEVLPQRSGKVRIEMTAGPLHSALRQASIVASDESRGIDFVFGDGTLVLSGSTAEIGQSRVELPVAYEGEEVGVALDYRFVIDFLKVLDPEKSVTVDVDGGEAAAMFLVDDGYGYVVMPLSRDG